jgi:hypothetical protein
MLLMSRDDRRVRTAEERARALTMGALVVVLFFAAGLFVSLRAVGLDIASVPSPGQVEPRTVDGTVTYVRVDRGGHAVACSSTYSSSVCSTVGVVVSRGRSGSK